MPVSQLIFTVGRLYPAQLILFSAPEK